MQVKKTLILLLTRCPTCLWCFSYPVNEERRDEMVAWIGASHKQRMTHYILPEARKALREDWAGQARADILRQVEQVETWYAEDASPLRDRKRDRRLASLRRQYRAIGEAEALNQAIVEGKVR
jgi:hypothetical protein